MRSCSATAVSNDHQKTNPFDKSRSFASPRAAEGVPQVSWSVIYTRFPPKTLISLTLHLMVHIYENHYITSPSVEFYLHAWICMKSLLIWEEDSFYLPYVYYCSWKQVFLSLCGCFFLPMYLSFEKFYRLLEKFDKK